MALAYEKKGQLSTIRPQIFEAYKASCLHLDSTGQATMINIILRSYLHQNKYEQARNFISKTSFPENAQNSQFARYLYYVGRIKAVQLEYSAAQTSLVQALRKGPEVGALGFRLQVQKLLVIVELLMGEVPHKQVFQNKEYMQHLDPYLRIVNCVKQGEMEQFKQLVQKNDRVFKSDKNMALIHRLQHTVIKFGLKKINISYSKIHLQDIMSKLGLESVDETEQIVAKAIRDGVIEATLNHDLKQMQSLSVHDQYASNDPQALLSKRIDFCMQLRNDAVTGLTYPQDEKKDYGDFGNLDIDETDKEKDLLADLLQEYGFDDDF
jgi:26S proteasome regulatory subunit N3